MGATKDLKLFNSVSEQAVIGGILKNPSCLPQVKGDISPSLFGSEKLAIIYATIEKIDDQGDPVDALILVNELEKSGQLQKAGGKIFIADLLESVGTSAGIAYHVEQLREFSIRRKLAALSSEILDSLRTEGQPVSEIISEIRGAVLAIKTESKARVISLQEALPETVAHIEKISKASGKLVGLPSGFGAIDRVTGGWQPGELIYIAGRPGMGKSVLAKDLAEASGVPVAYFSLEMSVNELVKRQLAGKSTVNFEALRTGRLNDGDWQKIIRGAERLSEIKIHYIDTGALTIDELVTISENLKMTSDIGLVIVDYLQLIKTKSRLEVREREVSEISRKLKALARNLEIPVLCLAQLNRQCELRGQNKRPLLSDLRESGSLEQDADVVAFIFREAVYDEGAPKHDAEFIIAKGRSTRTGTVKLFFDGSHQTFRSSV